MMSLQVLIPNYKNDTVRSATKEEIQTEKLANDARIRRDRGQAENDKTILRPARYKVAS